MDALFNPADQAPIGAQVNTDAAEAKAAKNEKLRAMRDALNDTVKSDPDFAKKLRRLSNSIEVVNTLGYGKKGNIVRDKNVGGKGLIETSVTCGYVIKNIGTEAVEYQTEVFAQDAATGKFVGTKVKRTLAPGATAALTRMYMTIFCAQPEISFTLANGKIVASSKKKMNSVEEELSAYYFKFSEAEDGTVQNVNDDAIKLSIDVDGVVKPEYVETFGFFNNPKEAKVKKAGAKGSNLTTQDLVANYVNQLIQGKGL